MLDKDWDAGGVLTVVLGNVKSPVPVSLPVAAVANNVDTIEPDLKRITVVPMLNIR